MIPDINGLSPDPKELSIELPIEAPPELCGLSAAT
jgi:hypothetical protein